MLITNHALNNDYSAEFVVWHANEPKLYFEEDQIAETSADIIGRLSL